MKTSIFLIMTMLGTALVSTGAAADDNYKSRQHYERYKYLKQHAKQPDFAHYDYAKVIRVEPIVKIVKLPSQRRVCRDGRATHDDHRAGFDQGFFPVSPDRRYQRHDSRCWVVDGYREQEQIEGYWVTYRYQGREYLMLMDQDPGRRIKVKVTVKPAAG